MKRICIKKKKSKKKEREREKIFELIGRRA